MNILIILALVVVFAGCTTSPKPHIDATNSIHSISQWSTWCGQSPDLRLRHEALIKWRGNTLPVSSFLVLTQKSSSAELVIMNGLGIKLATLTVNANTTVIKQGPPAGFPVRIVEMYALAIRRVFLLSFSCNLNGFVHENADTFIRNANEGQVEARLDTSTGTVQIIEVISSKEHWTLERHGTILLDGKPLPEMLTLRDVKSGFDLTLKLVQAEYDD